MSITNIDNFSQQFLLLVFLLKIIYYDTRVNDLGTRQKQRTLQGGFYAR